jgi:hypothetical protein
MSLLALSPRPLGRLAIVLLGLLVLEHALRLDGIVDGDHFFRQAHVLANVDGMLRDGIVAVPFAWNDNQALRLFDLPLYQAVVALLVRGTGLAPGLLAEALSLVLAILTAIAGARTLLRVGAPAWAVAAALLAFAASPIGRFWSCAALPDNLAMCLAAWSMAAGLARDAATMPRARTLHTASWLAAAFIATAIKPPVFLPVAAATVLLRIVDRRTGRAGGAALVSFACAAVAGIVLLRLLTTVANAGCPGWPDRATELAWYFGNADERSSLATHFRVLGRVTKEVVTLPGFGLAVVFWLRPTATLRPAHRLLATWSAAAIGSSLLFLHVNVVHNYYQLPCVLPLALSAGCGAWQVVQAIARRTSPPVAMLAALLLLAATALTSQRQFARIAMPTTSHLRAVGAFIAEHTVADDFVLYGTTTDDDNPAFLYFAQRRGHNTVVTDLERTAAERRPPSPRRLVVYTPPGTAGDLAARPGWRTLAAGPLGAVQLAP